MAQDQQRVHGIDEAVAVDVADICHAIARGEAGDVAKGHKGSESINITMQSTSPLSGK